MCTNCAIKIAPQDTEAFAGTLINILNNGATALMISIGYRTDLFNTMHRIGAATSQVIADAGGLNERYVREWLGTMTTAGIVMYDPHNGEYELPRAHALMLTNDPQATSIANTMQWISVLGQVETRIVECFKHGGGVPYSAYERFHDVMAEESDGTSVASIDGGMLDLEPTLRNRLERGCRLLDIGCGKGHVILELARRYPNSTFVGVDFSEEAIRDARIAGRSSSLTNIEFQVTDVAQLSYRGEFDVVTAFDAIHDQRDPAGVLRNVRGALSEGGLFVMQDIAGSSRVENNIGRPIAPLIYTISCMHCMSVSLQQGGAGLGAAWGEELALEMLGDAGFDQVGVHQLEHDIMNSYYIAKFD